MASRILGNIVLKNESSRSYVDALYAVLTPAGLFNNAPYMLSGMTGMAFVSVAHKNLIPASVDVYSLRESGWRSLDILGLYSEIYGGVNNSITFPLYQQKAVERVKQSIDAGRGAVVWAPKRMEFGVIYGYDDEDEVLFYKDRYLPGEFVMLYKNLGRTNSVFWMCQVIGDGIDKDIRDIYLDSMEVCVDEWEMPYKAQPHTKREFGSGRKAYEYMINALESRDYNNIGAIRIINCCMLCKNETYKYLKEVKKEMPEIQPAFDKYKELNEIFMSIAGLVPQYAPGAIMDIENIPRLVEYLREAKEAEDQAVGEVKKYLKDILNNRYIDALDVKKF